MNSESDEVVDLVSEITDKVIAELSPSATEDQIRERLTPALSQVMNADPKWSAKDQFHRQGMIESMVYVARERLAGRTVEIVDRAKFALDMSGIHSWSSRKARFLLCREAYEMHPDEPEYLERIDYLITRCLAECRELFPHRMAELERECPDLMCRENPALLEPERAAYITSPEFNERILARMHAVSSSDSDTKSEKS